MEVDTGGFRYDGTAQPVHSGEAVKITMGAIEQFQAVQGGESLGLCRWKPVGSAVELSVDAPAGRTMLSQPARKRDLAGTRSLASRRVGRKVPGVYPRLPSFLDPNSGVGTSGIQGRQGMAGLG